MSKKFNEYKGLDLAAVNREVLAKWETENTFEQSLALREGRPAFIFYEGPPSANGMPGIHHVLSRAIKDVFCRYKTQKGFYVKRKAGWDTHGLPVELAVEKMLGITKEDIGKGISVEEYNAACRKEVMKYTKEWEELTRKMGYWVDMNDPYITYDNRYIETLWWLLKQLYNKGLLYKGYTIQPYSPAAGTGLSTHELNQPGCYRDVKDTTCVAQFKVVDSGKLKVESSIPVYFLAWTTTPWTLPSNTALCVGPNIIYNVVKTENPYTNVPITVVLAKDLMSRFFGEKKVATFEVIQEVKGSELAGLEYEQLIPWVNPGRNAFRVITGDFVTTEDGTGIVHIAPTFGADDDRVAKQNGVPPLLLIDKNGHRRPMVDLSGKFYKIEDLDADFVKSHVNVALYKEWEGRYVKNDYIPASGLNAPPSGEPEGASLDVDLCVLLKQQGLAFKIEKHTHNYPHCWRTDKPVLYYPLDSWFIKTTACREEMIKLNNTINWKPQSTGTGRFGKWLENLQDWNLSRSRYWGTPLPIWRTEDGAEEICIGSVEELMQEIEKAIAAGLMKENPYKNFKAGVYTAENYEVKNIDLHRPYVDEIILVSAAGKPMKREADLIDVWFDSGAMPFAQLHYPFGPLNPPEGDLRTHYKTANPLLYGILKENAHGHKKNPTEAETVLWKCIQGKQLEGYKFRRQHIIDDIIVDFVCLSKKLVIEVDGGYHNNTQVKELDELKTTILNNLGYRVVRFKNEEVLLNTNHVLGQIISELESPPLGDLGGLYPADFISEGVDQTRGWFFTLHAISTMVKDSIAFKNVVSNGLVLDKNGNKMSKRLGNGIDPFSTIDKYGSDAVRWYMLTNASPWDNLKFDMEGVEEVRRKFFGTLYNTYSFFALYANVDNYTGAETEVPVSERPEIDRWIISLLNTLVKEVDAAYNDYDVTTAGRKIEDFVGDNLSNWYVRLNRKRFWGGEMTQDKLAAYQTLCTCLETVTQLAAPIAPFFMERLFDDINSVTKKHDVSSVHLTMFPNFEPTLIDKNLEKQMELAQRASSMVLALRRKVNIKVRQPLTKMLIPVLDKSMQEQLEAVKQLVLTEVNVKEMEFLTDTTGVIVKKIKPNFKTLGKKYGSQMKDIAAAVNAFTQEQISEIEKADSYKLALASGEVILQKEDVEITSEDMPGWLVATEGSLTVALDVTVTEALRREGIARELINRIQNLRKESNFNVTDKITIQIAQQPDIADTVKDFNSLIASQTLAKSIDMVVQLNDGAAIDLDDIVVKIKVTKV